MQIRAAATADQAAIWEILQPVILAGETYALPRDMTADAAVAYWTAHESFVASMDGKVVGTYYLRPNHPGGGGHVANCGYVTAADARGRGVARAMCEHSLAAARTKGFAAMQFNLVVATNIRAVRLWESLGFKTLCRLPGAFMHPAEGAVDALVMFQAL